MSDRELLELAAKAAGIEVHTIEDADGVVHWDGWNPLTDDGDALRLAVRLGLDVFSRPARWAECGRIGTAGCRENYSGSTDPQAATRRAITRAAAEIGKGMK
jgi:hypothetical protein